MKMLYHPKRILGFEPYVAPEGFDRKSQPVDIYDVFERYYRNHRDAKWIMYVSTSFTPHSYFATLSSNELPMQLGEGNKPGAQFIISYKDGGTRTTYTIPKTSFIGTIPDSNYSSIEVTSTSGYPNTGKISLGNYEDNSSYPIFQYDSKDETHFYWSGAPQRVKASESYVGKLVLPVAIFGTSTDRYIICSNSLTGMSNAAFGTSDYTKRLNGGEWVYCGDKINEISTCSPNAGGSSVKYIHIHKLSNITAYSYGGFRSSEITGTLYMSPSIPIVDIGGSVPGQFESSVYLTKVVIPNNITVLGWRVFNGNTGLTQIELPDSLTIIGPMCFSNCTGLNGDLVIPNSVTTVGYSAFQNCNKLDTLDLGTGVQTIGNSAFQACAQLSGTLVLPDSLTTIGTLAFYGCTSFSETLTIPANITSIGQGAFGDDNFTDIDVTANSRYEDVDDVLYEISTRTALHSVKSDTGTITFQTNTLIIGDYCCLRNQRTGTLTVPDSVTRVGIYAFYDCDGFTALDLETTTSALATIDDYAFAYLSNLAGTITIPDSVTLIDANAFRGLPKVTGLSFGTGLITIGQSAFENMIALAGNIVIPNSVETIGAYAFYNNLLITGLTFGSGVTSLATTAFNLCSGVTNINLGINGTTVTALIAQKAYFINLATLTIDASNPTYSMVSGCNILFNKAQTSVSWVPPKVTGDLYIPDGVTTIDSLSAINTFSGFFYLGSGLTSITNLYLSSKVFSTLDVSSSNPNYADNADNILYDKTLTQIFYVCKPGSGTLTIPGTITAIASDAFNNCSGYTALSLPSGFDLDIYNRWNFTDFTGSSLDASILNCIDGTPADPYKFQISETSLANLLAYNPDAVTDALARYIDVLSKAPVMDGLVCFLDAGDGGSYPGSGNTWYDLTGNGNNGTITGTVPWSVDKFQFPGTSGNYINIPSPNLAASSFTVQILARYSGLPHGRILSGLANNWVAGWHGNVMYRYYSEGWVYNPSSPAGDENWRFITAKGDYAGDKYSEYNGITAIVTDNAGGSQGPKGIALPRYGPGNSEYSQCEVSVLLIYNRVLTPAEIENNFKVYRDRYGI